MCTDYLQCVLTDLQKLQHGNWSFKQLNPVFSPHHLHEGLLRNHSETRGADQAQMSHLRTGSSDNCVVCWWISVMEHSSLATCFQLPRSFTLATRGDRLSLCVGSASYYSATLHDGHQFLYRNLRAQIMKDTFIVATSNRCSTWLLENLYQRWKRGERMMPVAMDLPGTAQPPVAAWWSQSEGKAIAWVSECLCRPDGHPQSALCCKVCCPITEGVPFRWALRNKFGIIIIGSKGVSKFPLQWTN